MLLHFLAKLKDDHGNPARLIPTVWTNLPSSPLSYDQSIVGDTTVTWQTEGIVTGTKPGECGVTITRTISLGYQAHTVACPDSRVKFVMVRPHTAFNIGKKWAFTIRYHVDDLQVIVRSINDQCVSGTYTSTADQILAEVTPQEGKYLQLYDWADSFWDPSLPENFGRLRAVDECSHRDPTLQYALEGCEIQDPLVSQLVSDFSVSEERFGIPLNRRRVQSDLANRIYLVYRIPCPVGMIRKCQSCCIPDPDNPTQCLAPIDPCPPGLIFNPITQRCVKPPGTVSCPPGYTLVDGECYSNAEDHPAAEDHPTNPTCPPGTLPHVVTTNGVSFIECGREAADFTCPDGYFVKYIDGLPTCIPDPADEPPIADCPPGYTWTGLLCYKEPEIPDFVMEPDSGFYESDDPYPQTCPEGMVKVPSRQGVYLTCANVPSEYTPPDVDILEQCYTIRIKGKATLIGSILNKHGSSGLAYFPGAEYPTYPASQGAVNEACYQQYGACQYPCYNQTISSSEAGAQYPNRFWFEMVFTGSSYNLWIPVSMTVSYHHRHCVTFGAMTIKNANGSTSYTNQWYAPRGISEVTADVWLDYEITVPVTRSGGYAYGGLDLSALDITFVDSGRATSYGWIAKVPQVKYRNQPVALKRQSLQTLLDSNANAMFQKVGNVVLSGTGYSWEVLDLCGLTSKPSDQPCLPKNTGKWVVTTMYRTASTEPGELTSLPGQQTSNPTGSIAIDSLIENVKKDPAAFYATSLIDVAVWEGPANLLWDATEWWGPFGQANPTGKFILNPGGQYYDDPTVVFYDANGTIVHQLGVTPASVTGAEYYHRVMSVIFRRDAGCANA